MGIRTVRLIPKLPASSQSLFRGGEDASERAAIGVVDGVNDPSTAPLLQDKFHRAPGIGRRAKRQRRGHYVAVERRLLPAHVGALLKELGFSHMSARPRHPGQHERVIEAFKKLSASAEGAPARTAGRNADQDLVSKLALAKAGDEARIGQKNGLARLWARQGTRPRQPAGQRSANAWLFGAICPARGKGAALALSFANTEMMQLHVDEITTHVAKGAHAALIFDRAGWHTTRELKWPANITPIWLPSRAPELNPVDPSINSR